MSVVSGRNRFRSYSRRITHFNRQLGSKKLACSKEPDGCARCIKEGIICHYSVQKQMGRPRKRPNEATTNEPPAQRVAMEADAYALNAVDSSSAETLPGFAATFSLSDSLLDTDMDTDIMHFLDNLSQDGPSKRAFGDNLPSTIDKSFDPSTWELDSSYNLQYPNLSESNTSDASPPELVPIDPSLISPISSTIARQPRTISQPLPSHSIAPTPPPPSNCPCLANLYQAMASANHLPQQLPAALQTVRSATQAAYAAVQCETCTPPLHELRDECSLTTFQVMMALGALLPSIAAAYHKILTLVDVETTRAISTQTDLSFSLIKCRGGDAWDITKTTDEEDEDNNNNTPRKASTDRSQVSYPAQWRNTVRALLKADVYGEPSPQQPPEQQKQEDKDFSQSSSPPPRQQSLSLHGLIKLMDQKSLLRHAQIDTMIEAGLTPPKGLYGTPIQHSRSADGRQPECRKVIAMAREAVERLVIA